jgi:hypothetical protein
VELRASLPLDCPERTFTRPLPNRSDDDGFGSTANHADKLATRVQVRTFRVWQVRTFMIKRRRVCAICVGRLPFRLPLRLQLAFELL